MTMEKVTPNKIAGFCSTIFAKYAYGNHIKICPYGERPERYYLQGEFLEIVPNAHNIDIPAILLKNGFLAHFSIQFIPKDEKKKQYYIKGVSLQIFKEKHLLFRAEWDNNDIIKTQHPQPHWHIEPIKFHSDIVKSKGTEISFKEYLDNNLGQENGFLQIVEQEQNNKINCDLGKFHFAMSSTWHEENGKCCIPLTENNLFKWLEKCLDNICTQLNYIVK